MDVFSAILGVVAGAAGAGMLAAWGLRRHIRKVRAAERRARSAERLAELGSMTSGLAHEIKNPLSTIGLNAQLLSEGIAELPIDAEQRGRLERRVGSLRREADRLRGILSDFLEFAGELRLDPKPADINAVVEELADFFMPQAQKYGVRLRTDLSPGPLNATMDERAVKQAVLNLLLNATQAMGGSGEAQVSGVGANGVAKELILKTVRTADADKQEMIQLHVIDTGPGIAPENVSKIFQPYFTTKSGGTGLGLPTSRRIVEAHHGRLEVVSEPGKGSDFVVSLPAA